MERTVHELFDSYLDNCLELKSNPNPIKESVKEPLTLKLFENVTINDNVERETSINSLNQDNKSQRFSYILEARNTSRTFADKKSFHNSCKELALEPEDILSGKVDFKWPHPKNIRNVSEYRMLSCLPCGTVIAEPVITQEFSTSSRFIHAEKSRPSKAKSYKSLPEEEEEKVEQRRARYKRKRENKKKKKYILK